MLSVLKQRRYEPTDENREEYGPKRNENEDLNPRESLTRFPTYGIKIETEQRTRNQVQQ